MVRALPSSSNTRVIVLSAIKKLMKNTAWTSRTIIKFIKAEYGLGEPKMSRKVSRALKRGVAFGLLQMEQGRYRLNDLNDLSPVAPWSQTRKQKKQQRNYTKRIHGRALYARRVSSN